jgi:hypothetical protein
MFQIDSPATQKPGFHWTPESQCRFIERLAETGSVRCACEAVSMARVSAYRFRRRAEALAFRVGWDAAVLIAREQHGDALMMYALAPVDYVGTRHPETRRMRWRRTDPALGRGRGLALLYRLDMAHAKIAADGQGYAMAQAGMGDFDGLLGLVAQGADTAAVTAFLARTGDQVLQPFMCNLPQNSGVSNPK